MNAAEKRERKARANELSEAIQSAVAELKAISPKTRESCRAAEAKLEAANHAYSAFTEIIYV